MADKERQTQNRAAAQRTGQKQSGAAQQAGFEFGTELAGTHANANQRADQAQTGAAKSAGTRQAKGDRA